MPHGIPNYSPALAVHPSRAGATPFRPANEVAAAELAKTGGSLNSVANGRLIRLSAGPNEWPVSQEWIGRELTGWTKRVSLWDKMITVTFYCELTSSAGRLPQFTLALKPPLSDEEITNAADTYMMLLNMVRL